MVAQRLTQITPPFATPDQLWQRVEAAWSAVPQEHIQSLIESMSRRVAAILIDQNTKVEKAVEVQRNVPEAAKNGRVNASGALLDSI
ncbi:hypothetical protein TNCV_3833601 [Trichonephila clavipes]|nr:hypothetical protein TNCV_3833601 [Trichonephila clavipes]